MPRSKFSIPLLSLLAITTLFSGCAEQPYGYIFVPEQRDQVNLARQAVDFISALYDHADAASGLLEKAGLTDSYSTILPDGWVEVSMPADTFYHFYKNYLDKEVSELKINRTPTPGALRTPSGLFYNFYSFASNQNSVTNEFYGSVDQVQMADIRYSDNYQNLKYIDAWYSISKSVPFEQEIEVQAQGSAVNYSYDVFLSVGWSMKVEKFSIDPRDQSGKIIIEGQFPILDDENIIQQCHVSGTFNINSKGVGGGDIWLLGQPAARLSFTGRSFGFKGKFTLFSENHSKTYSL